MIRTTFLSFFISIAMIFFGASIAVAQNVYVANSGGAPSNNADQPIYTNGNFFQTIASDLGIKQGVIAPFSLSVLGQSWFDKGIYSQGPVVITGDVWQGFQSTGNQSLLDVQGNLSISGTPSTTINSVGALVLDVGLEAMPPVTTNDPVCANSAGVLVRCEGLSVDLQIRLTNSAYNVYTNPGGGAGNSALNTETPSSSKIATFVKDIFAKTANAQLTTQTMLLSGAAWFDGPVSYSDGSEYDLRISATGSPISCALTESYGNNVGFLSAGTMPPLGTTVNSPVNVASLPEERLDFTTDNAITASTTWGVVCTDGIDTVYDYVVINIEDESCSDEIDNDGDGIINEGCSEICGDGIDNDQDGYVDYQDTDCTPFSVRWRGAPIGAQGNFNQFQSTASFEATAGGLLGEFGFYQVSPYSANAQSCEIWNSARGRSYSLTVPAGTIQDWYDSLPSSGSGKSYNGNTIYSLYDLILENENILDIPSGSLTYNQTNTETLSNYNDSLYFDHFNVPQTDLPITWYAECTHADGSTAMDSITINPTNIIVPTGAIRYWNNTGTNEYYVESGSCTGCDNDTFRVPAYVSEITYEMYGGGAGGGGAYVPGVRTKRWICGGGGGGAGAYTKGTLAVTPGQTFDVFPGIGGAAGTSGVDTNAATDGSHGEASMLINMGQDYLILAPGGSAVGTRARSNTVHITRDNDGGDSGQGGISGKYATTFSSTLTDPIYVRDMYRTLLDSNSSTSGIFTNGSVSQNTLISNLAGGNGTVGTCIEKKFNDWTNADSQSVIGHGGTANPTSHPLHGIGGDSYWDPHTDQWGTYWNQGEPGGWFGGGGAAAGEAGVGHSGGKGGTGMIRISW